ncbi:shikimate kinase [Spirulina sp. CS-785/01]|uniref:shikimate kinase n=1 Tax=Spirulina sp. CS-785/01 TaxID=3021716 RepID=UPI00233117DA|nr:shikimate kinase [Spirulina sp. CS-785/01]MDB9314753.1 shikimate kinase [Spirulina sp. CS-785/01]
MSVFLVGMMGAGKTTVGQCLAHRLGYRFFDTDVLIERVAGKPITEIFATEGEAYFRELESQVLQQVSACTRSAIATGGGIVLKPINWGTLQQGLVIWLDVPVEVLVERLQADNTRPLLQNTDLTEKLSSLLEQRRPRYAQADLHITPTAEQTPEEITEIILQKIPTVLKEQQHLPSEESE